MMPDSRDDEEQQKRQTQQFGEKSGQTNKPQEAKQGSHHRQRKKEKSKFQHVALNFSRWNRANDSISSK